MALNDASFTHVRSKWAHQVAEGPQLGLEAAGLALDQRGGGADGGGPFDEPAAVRLEVMMKLHGSRTRGVELSRQVPSSLDVLTPHVGSGDSEPLRCSGATATCTPSG